MNNAYISLNVLAARLHWQLVRLAEVGRLARPPPEFQGRAAYAVSAPVGAADCSHGWGGARRVRVRV